jgi:hypothetical protein
MERIGILLRKGLVRYAIAIQIGNQAERQHLIRDLG